MQCFFLRDNDEYSGLCKLGRYRDKAPMRGLLKGSASCHALILRMAKESLYKWFGSLFGLGVGIRKEILWIFWSIDFSHSSRKAWSILNNLTGRSRHSPRHCPVSADGIASQLVRNGKYEAVDRKSSRLVFQEVSDLWRATTPDAVNISDNFSLREFAAALQHLKPGKAPGPDSICPELILHPGAALKFWLRDFLSSCLRRLKISKIWRKALVVAIPKPARPMGDPNSYRPTSLLSVSPTRSSRGLSMPALNR